MTFLHIRQSFFLFLAVLKNSCLPMGCDISIPNVNSGVKILYFRSDNGLPYTLQSKTQNDILRRSLCHGHFIDKRNDKLYLIIISRHSKYVKGFIVFAFSAVRAYVHASVQTGVNIWR